jgi:hypothetical protein
MNHLHVLLLPFPYTFDAVAVIALSDVAVDSEAFVVQSVVSPSDYHWHVAHAAGWRMLVCGCSGTQNVNLRVNGDPREAVEL